MTHRAGRRCERQFRLIEYVRSIAGIVVRGQRDLALVRGHGAGHEVLIEAIVASNHGPIANGPRTGLMLYQRGSDVDAGSDVAVIRVTVVTWRDRRQPAFPETT